MRIPSSVRVGPIDFEILVEAQPIHDGTVMSGIIKYEDEQIVLREGMGETTTLITLWHEVLHAITVAFGFEVCNNENLIEALAHGIVAVLKNNPNLYPDFFVEEAK